MFSNKSASKRKSEFLLRVGWHRPFWWTRCLHLQGGEIAFI